jgi:hypothetical protein
MKVIRVIPLLEFAAPPFFNAAGNARSLLDAGLLSTNPNHPTSSTRMNRVGSGHARPRCTLLPRSAGAATQPDFEIRGRRSSAAIGSDRSQRRFVDVRP